MHLDYSANPTYLFNHTRLLETKHRGKGDGIRSKNVLTQYVCGWSLTAHCDAATADPGAGCMICGNNQIIFSLVFSVALLLNKNIV